MTTIPIDLSRSPGARLVINNLVDMPVIADLDSDLVLVELPGDVLIDVSWYPEHDWSGAYYITLFRRGDFDHPLAAWKAGIALFAASWVKALAEWYSKREMTP